VGLLKLSQSVSAIIDDQRHRDWGPYTPVGPASWTMGTDNLKLCTIGKKIFCTGSTGSAVQFFILPLPSKFHRLTSASTRNEPVNILWIFGQAFRVGHFLKGQ
jgi:hypothetical protein